MGKKFFVSLALLAALGAGLFRTRSEAFAADIKGKHASEGLGCADCHKTDKPTAAAGIEACLDCHGGYDKVAERTKGMHNNPHDSHLGRMACLKCHRVHAPSEYLCLECHSDFEFKDK
ncbi:cytochrome c3 family protein [Geomonas nitrogeniifigens]|uniref:cytochrome c3 family protein n=1 Tax=Geomonas diazotrophica TaxID=2843197 RepID=UPI001C2C1B5F|nr:cytochrome c3 family protein [Geomonas nitrogeniifigens]QXE87790.1 cytochrome c3 family protein [Geomonas nitrogeniifigens]